MKGITPTVAAIGQLPQVPHLQFAMEWFDHVTFENGKPHLQAMTILADAIFWYSPVPVKDAATGMIVGYERSFSDDLLQRSYSYYEERYGMSTQQARTALDKLEALGVAWRVVKDVVEVGSKVLSNVMYIDVNPQRIYEISTPKAMRSITPLLYITDPSVIHNRPLCYTQQTYTDKTIYRVDTNSAADGNLNPAHFGQRTTDRRLQAIQLRLAEAAKVGLDAQALRLAAEKLAEIHGVKALIEIDENEYTKMQDFAILLAGMNLRTPAQLDELYKSWSVEDGIGRKETAEGKLPKPPKGNQLVKHASWLTQEGRVDATGTIKQLPTTVTSDSAAAAGQGSGKPYHRNGDGNKRGKPTGRIGEKTLAIQQGRAELIDLDQAELQLQQWLAEGGDERAGA